MSEPDTAWPRGDGEMARRIRNHDWSDTSLGPTARWPQGLRIAVDLMLAAAQPALIAWGAELVSLYNDSYIPIAGTQHPAALGQPYRAMWGEVWDDFRATIDAVMAGESRYFVDQPLALAGRPDRPVRWFTYSWTPLRTDTGAVGGFYYVATETTERVLAERALEARYRALFEAMDEGICIIELVAVDEGTPPDFRYLEVNAAFERQTGLHDVADKLGSVVVPGAGSYWHHTYAEVVRTGEPQRVENYNQDTGRWYDIFASRVGGAGSRQVCVVSQDVTERREREERQTFLLKLSDALRPLVGAEEICRTAAAVLGAHLRASRVAYADDGGDDETFVVQSDYSDGLPGMVGRYRYADYGADVRSDLLAGRNRIQSDIARDVRLGDAERRTFARTGIGASLKVPLMKGGRLVAFLGVSHAAPHAFAPREVALVEEVAERTWAAVERARAEARLRASEARLAAAFEGVPVGAAVVDLSGEILLANARYRRFLPSSVIPSRDSGIVARWRGWDAAGEPLPPERFPGARALRGENVVPGQEMLYTDDEGRSVWTNVATVPTRGERGQVTGAVSVIADIDTVKRGAEALRESEERLRQFGDASQDVLWIRDAKTLQWQYLTPAFEQIYGLDRATALVGDNFGDWLKLVIPDDRARALDKLERVRRGERTAFEYRIRRPSDGAIRWLRNTDFPIRDHTGEIVLIGGVGHDLTELRETELRLRALMEGIPQLVWRAVDGGDWTWASPQWTDFTGQAESDSHGWGWLAPLHPDDRPAAREAWRDAAKRGGIDVEYRLCERETGAYRWFQTRATPVRDQSGRIIEWLGTSTDIHDLRLLQDRQQVMVKELQHRTRNLITVVGALSSQTMKNARTLRDFDQRFGQRLAALSRVQGLLSHLSAGRRVTFDELLRAELNALGAPADRIVLDGPAGVPLRSATVQTFSLALHELATNALKYGALAGAASGRLAVTWRVDRRDGPRLLVDWRESGVDMTQVREEGRPGGYGRELIERALPYQLGAHTTYAITTNGVHCTIDVAIPQAPTETDRERAHTA